MYITWYGQSCLKIECKTNQGDVVVLVDPFDAKETGLKLPRSLKADVVLQSQKGVDIKEEVSSQKEGEKVFLIDKAGEYEKGGVYFGGVKINNNGHLIFTIEAEDLHLLYCGSLPRLPADKEIENIENIDILFVPVGGHGALTAKEAAELVNELEPRVVIPVFYKLPGLKMNLDAAEAFLKLVGAKAPETQERLKIVKKDLPQEETKVYLLNPPY